MSDVKVDKEGAGSVYLKKKWKPKHIVLSGASLLLKAKAKDEVFDENISIKGAKVTAGAVDVDAKKKGAITIEAGGVTTCIQFGDDAEAKEWTTAIEKGGAGEEVSVNLAKKKQSAMMAIKKNVSGKAATSGAGKGLIKEELGKGGVRCLEIIKQIITEHEGKKKATEVEDNLIRLAVKVILLWRNKDLSTQDLMKTMPQLRAVWSNIIDFCEMSFAYDPAELAKNSTALAEVFMTLLQRHVTDKTISMMKETLQYATQEALMDRLFKDDKGEELKKELEGIVRKAWIKVFKDAKK